MNIQPSKTNCLFSDIFRKRSKNPEHLQVSQFRKLHYHCKVEVWGNLPPLLDIKKFHCISMDVVEESKKK